MKKEKVENPSSVQDQLDGLYSFCCDLLELLGSGEPIDDYHYSNLFNHLIKDKKDLGIFNKTNGSGELTWGGLKELMKDAPDNAVVVMYPSSGANPGTSVNIERSCYWHHTGACVVQLIPNEIKEKL